VSSSAGAGLSEISTDDLLQLSDALRNGILRAPLTAAGLEHGGFGYLRDSLLALRTLDVSALCLLLDAVLAERKRGAGVKLDLVWSGTDAGPSYARYTKLVIPELIDSAQHQVAIAGYSFDQGAGVFDRLHQAITQRNVGVRFFLDIEQLLARLQQQLGKERWKSRLAPVKAAQLAGAEPYAREVISLFLELHWPFEGPKPELYYDPRTADPYSFASLHAKCLIVDHEHALITSANFTDRGQARNIEAGVLIHDKGYAGALERQWNNLIESAGVVRA
jgi:phosphatidylserine/phosphatidylglycerophosphate/cardiolipin synthase-like enzyme